MTSPTAIGGIGIGASLFGGLLSAFGAEKSGQAQQQMYNYQAAVAQINSSTDKQNMEYSLYQGEEQAEKFGIQAGQRQAAIRTAYSAGNIDVNSGSAAQVQGSQKTLTGIDTAQIRENAAKTAYDYDVRSVMDTNQATLDVMAGQNAKIAGDINATASILGTAGSVSSKWLQGTTVGMFGGSGGSPSIVGATTNYNGMPWSANTGAVF